MHLSCMYNLSMVCDIFYILRAFPFRFSDKKSRYTAQTCIMCSAYTCRCPENGGKKREKNIESQNRDWRRDKEYEKLFKSGQLENCI